MKKRYKMVDLDCANCAAKMEDAIRKIDGVHDASVSFLTQKLTIDADESRLDDIMARWSRPASGWSPTVPLSSD